MKHLRAITIGTLPLIFLLLVGYFYLVYKNNVDVAQPSKQEIKQALDKSINWVLKNQDELIQINNPVLWWFLDESAYLTNNNELSKLVRRYRNTVLNKNSVWTGYWVKSPPFTYIPGSLDHMEKYQKFFVYALSCDTELGEEKVIQEQLNINFCDWKPLFSSCSTHQLMSVRLLQAKNCTDKKTYQQLSIDLIKNIHNQMFWDPRVGDLYMQRVLMLLESSNKDKVKPVWLQRIIKEQRNSGGWANFYKMFNITDTLEFGFGYVTPEIQSQPTISFHTTAQAIYLLSMVNSKKKSGK